MNCFSKEMLQLYKFDESGYKNVYVYMDFSNDYIEINPRIYFDESTAIHTFENVKKMI